MFTKMKQRKVERKQKELKRLEEWKQNLDKKYEDYVFDVEHVNRERTKNLLESEIKEIEELRNVTRTLVTLVMS